MFSLFLLVCAHCGPHFLCSQEKENNTNTNRHTLSDVLTFTRNHCTFLSLRGKEKTAPCRMRIPLLPVQKKKTYMLSSFSFLSEIGVHHASQLTLVLLFHPSPSWRQALPPPFLCTLSLLSVRGVRSLVGMCTSKNIRFGSCR